MRAAVCAAIVVASLFDPRDARVVAAQSQSVEAELVEFEQRLLKAVLEGDRAAYDAMLSPDWSVIHIDGRVRTKAQVLQEAFGGPERPVVEGSMDELAVRAFGDFAVVTGRTFAKARNGLQVVLRFTDVFAKRAGRWQVVASQATAVGPVAP